jgi:hypothetical protein
VETFRCPACLYLLTDPGQRRCPSCRKRLGQRRPPIVLADRTKFSTHEPLHIDLVLEERAEYEKKSRRAEPRVTSLAAALETQQVDTRVAEKRHWVAPPPAPSPPMVAAPPLVGEPDSIQHTTIYQPSQFDPEMRQVLDDLYRKARSQTDDYDEYYDDGP